MTVASYDEVRKNINFANAIISFQSYIIKFLLWSKNHTTYNTYGIHNINCITNPTTSWSGTSPYLGRVSKMEQTEHRPGTFHPTSNSYATNTKHVSRQYSDKAQCKKLRKHDIQC
jgi:hypothetical protein